MSEVRDERTSSPRPRRKRNWRVISLVAAVVLVLAGLVAWSIADQNDRARQADEVAAARTRVAATALEDLKKSTHGAIAPQAKVNGDDWKNGRIDVLLTVGTCRNVPGYVETVERPTTDSWGIMHVLVAGKNTHAPPADVRIITGPDLSQLKQTLNDNDSGLRHCVVGDWRLFPVDG